MFLRISLGPISVRWAQQLRVRNLHRRIGQPTVGDRALTGRAGAMPGRFVDDAISYVAEWP
jgi:hypothetical protein